MLCYMDKCITYHSIIHNNTDHYNVMALVSIFEPHFCRTVVWFSYFILGNAEKRILEKTMMYSFSILAFS